MMAFALSLDDFVVSNFVSGTTLPFPVWVYGASRMGVPPQVFVFGTIIFLLGFAGAIASLMMSRRSIKTI
jgi:spermidine/putrescine transport system permease protein